MLLLAALAWAQENETTPEELETEEITVLAEPAYGPMEAGLTEAVLDNGMTVTIYTDPDMPEVATQMWVDVGSAHELDGERGLAHLFEHLVFSAPPDAGPAEYSRFHTIHGGYKNAWTSADNTAYVSKIPPQHHDEVLRMNAWHFLNIHPDEEMLEREKQIVAEELRMRTTNDPMARIQVDIQTSLWAGHPYERIPVGTLADIDNFTMANVQAFSERYYRAENMHLVIVGPVHGQRTLDRVTELYGPMPSGAADKTVIPDTLAWDFPEELDVTEEIPPIRVHVQGYPLPPLDHQDALAVEVLLQMLSGGTLDQFREQLVTEQKGALEAFSAGGMKRSGGLLMFGAVTLPLGPADKVWGEIEEALTVLDGGAWIDQEAFSRVSKRERRRMGTKHYFAAEMASLLGWSHQNLGAASAAIARIEAMGEVSLEDVRRAWTTYVTEGEAIRLYAHREG